MTVELTPRQQLLLDSLSVAVPMRIAELLEDVPAVRWARIEEWRAAAVEPVASRGDVLMYGGKRGDAAEAPLRCPGRLRSPEWARAGT